MTMNFKASVGVHEYQHPPPHEWQRRSSDTKPSVESLTITELDHIKEGKEPTGRKSPDTGDTDLADSVDKDPTEHDKDCVATERASHASAGQLSLTLSEPDGQAHCPPTPTTSDQDSISDVGITTLEHKQDSSALATVANSQARDHIKHFRLPLDDEDPLIAHQDMHLSDVKAICTKIQRVLDLRHSFMTVSNQLPGANPKDSQGDNTRIQPPETRRSTDRATQAPEDLCSVNTSGSTQTETLAGTNDISTQSFCSQTEKEPGESRKFADNDFTINKFRLPGRAITPHDYTFSLDSGSIFQVYTEERMPLSNTPTLQDYYESLDEILKITSDGPVKSYAHRRLQYLESRYGIYTLLNQHKEMSETKKVPHRDFYNVRKVDTHVHHSACMNQKHLLRFIKSKMKKCPNEVVLEQEGKQQTLSQVFEAINLTSHDLSIDNLDMHAHTDSFHRFDKFNLKYNPVGQSQLRDIFLKTDNFIKGRYLAEITREAMTDLEDSKYQMVEWRLSIYGRSIDEWDKLAAWIVDNNLFSPNVRWLVQIPRLFTVYKSLKLIDSFEEVIRNIFRPLFEVTQDPSSHPKLHTFLQRVVGFDSVDDESKVEPSRHRTHPLPRDWTAAQDPPYDYWIYYIFANMASLNAWRKRREFNTFVFRPHCGEAGDPDHLAAAFLCCYGISHGLTLRKVPLMQYVFYLDQIGIAMSPLSNNALFLTYDRNPFISYFKKGLNVSLSTDDPLQFAFTREPLIEEYSVAAQIYKLNAVDMCELAGNSVDQSGFELALKQKWLGKRCYLPGVPGNDTSKSNIPDVRKAFRHETLRAEHNLIANFVHNYIHLERRCRINPDLNDPLASNRRN